LLVLFRPAVSVRSRFQISCLVVCPAWLLIECQCVGPMHSDSN
jgi:hypothetical protein